VAESPDEPEFLRQFRLAWEEGNRAWNEGDFKRAYGGLPEGFEYHVAATWPQARSLMGPDEIVAFFEELRETFPDVRSVRPQFVQVGEQTVIIGFDVIGTGGRSGVSTEMEIWQVWEFGDDGQPSSLREFSHRSEAFEAAGVDAPAAGGRD
jgi:SnoaL-like protein